MLTFFSIPKPFNGHIEIIQRNAIQSWCLLHQRCEVILFGDEEGTKEVADELNIRHIPEMERNKFGTPLLNGVFRRVQELATYSTVCYVNADIILMSDFLEAVKKLHWHKFLMIGRRWDIELNELLNFTDINWEGHLRAYVKDVGFLTSPTGVDYLVFPRGLLLNIPPFAVGRLYWVRRLIYDVRAKNIPVIDATPCVMAVHQNHESPGYLKAGSEEAKENLKLIQNKEMDALDANWLLTKKGLKPAITIEHLWRRKYRLSMIHPIINFLLKPVGLIFRIAKIFASLKE
jgi:hypothetical protein